MVIYAKTPRGVNLTQSLTIANRVNEVLRPVPKWLVYLRGALPGLYIIAGVALALI